MEEIVSDSYIWTTQPLSSDNNLHNSLQQYESTLRCSICKSFYCNPVIITTPNCQHTFCSECIRTYFRNSRRLSAKGSSNVYCPTCRTVTDERKMVPNRTVAECVHQWIQMRSSLLDAMILNEQKESLAQTGNNAAVNTIDDDNSSSESMKKKRKHIVNENIPIRLKRSRRTTSQPVRYRESDTEDDGAKYKPDTNKNFKKLRPKPPTNYHGMKHNKLQALCEAENIGINGSDQELKLRHMEFITMYNAECDAINPRSHLELVKEFKKRKRLRKEEKIVAFQTGSAKHSTYVNKLVTSSHQAPLRNRNCGNDDDSTLGGTEHKTEAPSSGNADFDEQFRSGFKKLIENAKRKRSDHNKQKTNKPKNQASQETTDDNTENEITNPPPTILTESNNSFASVVDTASDVNLSNMSTGQDSESQPLHHTVSSTTSLNRTCESNLSSSLSSQVKTSSTPSLFSELSPKHCLVSNHKQTIVQQNPSKNHNHSPTYHGSEPQPISSTSSSRITQTDTSSLIGPWVCPTCTYRNVSRTWTNASCEMCEEKRPFMTTPAATSTRTKAIVTIDI